MASSQIGVSSGALSVRQGSSSNNNMIESQAGMSLLRRSSQLVQSAEPRQLAEAKISKIYEPFFSPSSTHSDAAAANAAANHQRDQLSLITSAPRSKKVYIYTGQDEFKPTIYPITVINSQKPKSSIEDAPRLSPKVGGGGVRPTNRGILKRKGQESLLAEDLSAFSSIDDPTNNIDRETNGRRQDLNNNINNNSNNGGTSNKNNINNNNSVGLTPSAPIVSGIGTHNNNSRSLNTSTALIKPSQKNPAGVIGPPDTIASLNASTNNLQSIRLGQQSLQQQQQPGELNDPKGPTIFDRNRNPSAQGKRLGVLLPQDEGAAAIPQDAAIIDSSASGGKKYNSSNVQATQTLNQNELEFEADLKNQASKIPFRKNVSNNGGIGITTVDRTPNRVGPATTGAGGFRGLHYQIDDFTNVSTAPTVVSPIATPLAMMHFTETESNKFVHTQSYLKRRIENMERQKLNGSMPMLNELVSLPRSAINSRNGQYESTSSMTPVQPTQDGVLAQQQRNLKMMSTSRYNQQPRSVGGGGGKHFQTQAGAFSDDDQQVFLTDTEQQSSKNAQKLQAMKLLRSKRRTASQTLSPFKYERSSFVGGGNAQHKVSIDTSELPSSMVEGSSKRSSPMQLNRSMHSRTPTSRYPVGLQQQQQQQQLPKGAMVMLHNPQELLANPLLRDFYQLRMNNIPLSNERLITDPMIYTHQAYQRSNMQRQQNQNRMIGLLEEQDKIMGKIIEKYKIRANKEEVNLKQKLSQLEKERDHLFRLKTHEQTLGKIKANLNNKLDSFKSDAQFYNEQLSPQMPALPAQRYAIHQPDMHDLVFLDSIIASQQNQPLKNRYFNQVNSNLNRQKRSRSQLN